MPLTDTEIRNAKPNGKPQKLFDGGGLFLLISPSGGKWWRLKYRFNGKEKLLSLGTYPDVPLAGRKGQDGKRIDGARDRRDQARKLLDNGIDPSEERKAIKAGRDERAANSFAAVAVEWLGIRSGRWADSTASKTKTRLEKDVFPWLGNRPIAEITAPEVLAVLRKIVSRGAVHTAHKAKQDIGQVFRYAVENGCAERDPTRDFSRNALPTDKTTHFASITDPKEVGALGSSKDSR